MAPTPPPPRKAALHAFDASAPDYDGTWESLPGTARLRRIIREILDSVFPAGSSVLELNAGTGTDALHLAGRGVRVLATDGAPAMVEKIREKAAASGVDIRTRVVPLEDLRPLGNEVFDGALSSMGGVNCIPDLRATAQELRRHLRPGSPVVLGFMPRVSLWESSAFLLRGKLHGAFRRMRNGPVSVQVAGERVPTWYHSPGSVIRALQPWFLPGRILGLNVVSPPPGSTRMARHGGIVRLLDHADDLVGKIPPFSRLGDHCVIVFRAAGRTVGAKAR